MIKTQQTQHDKIKARIFYAAVYNMLDSIKYHFYGRQRLGIEDTKRIVARMLVDKHLLTCKHKKAIQRSVARRLVYYIATLDV